MKKKMLISICASALLAGTNLFAFSMSGHGSHGSNGGGVDIGGDGHGGHVCIEGHDFMGHGGSAGMSYGSAQGCDKDDFDFYYQSFGGFIKGTEHADSPNMLPGLNDVTEDGPWFREGEFSSHVTFGDVTNGNKCDTRDPNGGWPAVAWGHQEANPWMSGEGDNKGGASGLGITGFGLGDGNKIKKNDEGTFYPVAMISAVNYTNSFTASMSTDLSWNVKIYSKKKHKELYSKNYSNTIVYWETLNYSNDEFKCPRSSVAEGSLVNDLAFNTRLHNDFSPYWPVYGLDNNYVGDGGQDKQNCADAIKAKKELNFKDTFKVNRKTYEISFNGPWIYQENVEGCPELDETGMPDTAEKWDEKCFKKVDTLWAQENATSRAFMRMHIKKIKNSGSCHGSKDHGSKNHRSKNHMSRNHSFKY